MAEALILTDQDWRSDHSQDLILKQEIEWLTRNRGPDGLSELERIYKFSTCENHRNAQVERIILDRLDEHYPKYDASFQADCQDNGYCRFHLRLGLTHKAMLSANPSHETWNANLLKPFEEWERPPKPQQAAERKT